jgi:uncharacterized protein DUF547
MRSRRRCTTFCSRTYNSGMGFVRTAVILWATTAPLLLSTQQFTPAPGVEELHRPLDQILDLNVRDGLVYYRALKGERGRLDRYVASLNVPAATYQGWSRNRQMAFWVDAYNAFVLETIINHYPINGTASAYPPHSIRQIPGAFERTTWKAAGKTVTLDQIEKTILPDFKEPRLYLALGRGAVGSGRLRSEAYTGERLEGQLAAIEAEFVNTLEMIRMDRTAGQMAVTPILSWHEQEFVAQYDKGDQRFAQRSPIERAVIAFVRPHLLPLEKEFVEKNEFHVVFQPFDWHLNDLTGRS